jgi:DNA-binding NarL/FixJ family response regulator
MGRFSEASEANVDSTESPKSAQKKRRVFIVDDHPIFRAGITQLVNHQAGLVACGGAEAALEAMEEIGRLKPDLVIVDISLKGTNGLELIKSLRAMFPEILVLVVSMHEESLYAERVLRAGARGYVMKQEASEKVMTAIEAVLGGSLYLSDAMNAVLVRKLTDRPVEAETGSPVFLLTDRELEIFHLIGRGVGTSQIADKLNLSVKTVDSHRANMKKKLKFRSAPDLVRFAVAWESEGGT